MAQFELRGEASTFTEDMYPESRAIRFKQDNPENFRTQTSNLAQKTQKPPVAPSLVLAGQLPVPLQCLLGAEMPGPGGRRHWQDKLDGEWDH